VAFDGSPEATRSLQAFVGTGLAALGEVHVISLDEDSAVRAAKTADRAVEYLRFHDIEATPQAHAGPAMPSSTAIREAARRLGAGLVVMGACGQSRFTEYLLGSVTRSLLHDSDIPLFLVH
jgi:nucleotide-binding universal stress UspA family protein